MAADKIVVRVKPYEGEYELDAEESPFTTLEWRWIKKIAGYMPVTIRDGLAGGDPDLILAFTVIALVRGGKVTKEQALLTADRLADAPVDDVAIEFVMGEESDDDPPAAAPVTAP